MNCGDANPGGNVYLAYKGGCMKELDIKDAYRCTGCGGWFHKDCIFKHFEIEKDHDYGRAEQRRIAMKVAEHFILDKPVGADSYKVVSKNMYRTLLRSGI